MKKYRVGYIIGLAGDIAAHTCRWILPAMLAI